MFPTFYTDPLAIYRPFPETPSSHFAAHWHEIALSTVFYFSLHISSPLLSKSLFGRTYSDLNVKTKLNFDIHVVSMVQCIISVALSIPAWNHPHFKNRAADPYNSIFGYNSYAGFVSAITIGYFIWDMYVCVTRRKLFGLGFLLHAFAALYVFCCSLRPYCLPWVSAFLLFELSTPFVNINWFASRLPAGTVSDTVVAVNGIVLIVVFFCVRIVWGFYAVGLVAYDMYRVADHDHIFFPITILSLNFALDVLNVFWFSRMIAIAAKKIRGAKTSQVVAETASLEVE